MGRANITSMRDVWRNFTRNQARDRAIASLETARSDLKSYRATLRSIEAEGVMATIDYLTDAIDAMREGQ